ncbi:MAG TPA: hypothetical protein VK783_11510 [Bacteroidia bacterium]|jgi:hypothetical protein|nr:hypothetical protein [Bacteroidia bacterium]
MNLKKIIFRILVLFPLFSISNIVFGQKSNDEQVISIVENFLSSDLTGYKALVKNKSYYFYEIENVLFEKDSETDSIEIYGFGDGISEGGWNYLLFKYKKQKSFVIIGQYPSMQENIMKLSDVMYGTKSISANTVKKCYDAIIANYDHHGYHMPNDLIKDSIR